MHMTGRPPLTRRSLLRLAVLGIAGAALSACRAPEAEPPPAPPRAAPVVPTLERASTATVLVGADIGSLDPQFAISKLDQSVHRHLFEPLIGGVGGPPQPGLAIGWQRVAPTAWEIRLREGASLDAEAVAYTVERGLSRSVRALEPALADMEVQRAEVVDRQTVRLHTRTPSGVLPTWLQKVLVLAPSHYQGLPLDRAAREPLGNGPYRLVEWARGSHLVLEAQQSQARVRTLLWRVEPDPAARVAAVREGRADLAIDIPLDVAAAAQGVGIASAPSLRKVFLGMGTTSGDQPALHEVRVRQAIVLALDWDRVVRETLGGQAVRATSLYNPPNGTGAGSPAHDPGRARVLLAEAGYPSGLEVLLEGPRDTYGRDEAVLNTLAASLAEVGIRADVRPSAFTPMLGRIRLRQMHGLFLLGLGDEWEPALEAHLAFGSALDNGTDWASPVYDRLHNEVLTLDDPAERRPRLLEMEQVLVAEAPLSLGYHPLHTAAVGPRLAAWAPRPDGLVLLDGAALQA